MSERRREKKLELTELIYDILNAPIDVSGSTVTVTDDGNFDVSGVTFKNSKDLTGGASQQDIVDAVMDSALAQISTTEEDTLLTDATTGQSTNTQTNSSYLGVIVWVNIDSLGGTSPSLTAKIQRQSPGGVWQDVLSSGGLTNTGLTTLQVHPSVPDVSNERAGEILGRDWRVDVTVDTSDGDETYQYDIEYTYID